MMRILKNKLLLQSVLLLGFMSLAIVLNIKIIRYNMMYFEQPLLYSAYQHLHSWHDLLMRYLHPQFLELTVPFFRPSGHYLLYYLLVPIFGWHNQQAFIIVDLCMLGVCGYFMLRIYEKLFPGYFLGGLFAFAIFLMHPAMVAVRLMIMHFEYAYLMVSLMALYYFIVFVQKNNSAHFTHFKYLAYSLLLLIAAVTFKEPALMLGPVFCAYLFFQARQTTITAYFENDQIIKINFLIFLTTFTMFIYITLPWPSLIDHPMDTNSWGKKYWATLELIKIFLGIQPLAKVVVWQLTIAPIWAKIVMIGGSCLALKFFLPSCYSRLARQDKNSLLFLVVAALLFLILPIGWAMAMPWHLSLTLICLALVIGFAIDNTLKNHALSPFWIGIPLALGIACITFQTNIVNINLVQNRFGMPLDLDKNAVFSPPPIQNKLNKDSIIVVEDYLIQNPYVIGNSRYPFLLGIHDFVFDILREWEKNNFLKTQPTFNGNLFKMAYQIPTLREEEYPFTVNNLRAVSSEILYNWLQHINNIFCFGYDRQSQWHDDTAAFKTNLLAEQRYRNLPVHTYHKLMGQEWAQGSFMHFLTPISDPEACEMKCDEFSNCKAAVMLTYSDDYKLKSECVLYSKISKTMTACSNCGAYIKNTSPLVGEVVT